MNWLRITRVTAASEPLLTAEEVRAHLRIASTAEDSYLESLVAAATAYIEGPTGAGIPLIPSEWRLSLDCLPCEIDIDLCPVLSIESITVDGETLAPELYDVDLDCIPARIVGKWAQRHVGPGKVKVIFSAGYTDVPADLKQAALMLVGHLYENREAVTAGAQLNEVPMAVETIISRYRANAR